MWKIVFKILFAIAWLGLFLISSAGIYFAGKYFFLMIENQVPNLALKLFGVNEDKVQTNIEIFKFKKIHFLMMSGFFMFYYILFVEKLSNLFKNKRLEKPYVFDGDNGKISVSMNSVNNVIINVLRGKNFIKSYKVFSKVSSQGVKVKLNLDIKSRAEQKEELNEELHEMQNEIINYVEKVIGVKVANVLVNLLKVDFVEEEKKAKKLQLKKIALNENAEETQEEVVKDAEVSDVDSE